MERVNPHGAGLVHSSAMNNAYLFTSVPVAALAMLASWSEASVLHQRAGAEHWICSGASEYVVARSEVQWINPEYVRIDTRGSRDTCRAGNG